jgi:hypothetical protein
MWLKYSQEMKERQGVTTTKNGIMQNGKELMKNKREKMRSELNVGTTFGNFGLELLHG